MLRARPVIALPDGTVVAGNQRVVAAKGLGWESIPTVFADLDEQQQTRWMLLDNRPFGEDVDTQVAELLQELDTAGADLLLTGYDSSELDRIMAAIDRTPADPDAAPPILQEPKSKLGEVYELGSHRLMCGDATSEGDVATLMDGTVAAMVFTDPPYGVGYDGGTKVREKLVGDETTELYAPTCLMAARYSSSDAPLYLWHAGVKGIAAAAAAAAAGYVIRCELVWNKNQAQFGSLSAQYKQKHEPCYYCFKRGKTVNWSGPTNEVTVWDIDRSSVNEFHPTQKPVELAARALRNHAAPSVLDLFGGSGSTLLAAEVESSRAYVMEIDPGYCDVIRQRYADYVNRPDLAP